MSNYYQTTLEQVAEWFMQLFFDPMYHVESVSRPNDVSTQKQVGVAPASMRMVTAILKMEAAIKHSGLDRLIRLRQIVSKAKNFNYPNVHFRAFFNQLSLENWWYRPTGYELKIVFQ